MKLLYFYYATLNYLAAKVSLVHRLHDVRGTRECFSFCFRLVTHMVATHSALLT